MSIKLIPDTPYRKIFWLGLLVQVIAAWFSVGYNHSDEHFQVLEFCNYKLGLSPASALPWEFGAQCRAGLQPFIAFCVCRGLQLIGLYNPFRAAFLLRLGMGLLTWVVTCRIVLLMLPQFVTDKGKRAYVWCSFLLWFVPYIGVRFSAESFSGVLFFLAISLLLDLNGYTSTKRNLRLLFAGLLLGFTLVLRLQMAFAFAGLGLWLILYSKWRFSDWLIIIIAGLAAIGLGAVTDHWLYGDWVFTPYNYYYVNIVQHKAANFGTAPWWEYFVMFIDYAVPPISIILLPLFLYGIWKKPRHLFTWISVAFIAGHCLIAHKEMRFLLPVSIAFIYLVCSGVDALAQRYDCKKGFRWALNVVAGINIALLLIKIFTPAHEAVNYYKFIYNYAQAQPTTLISYEKSPYSPIGLEMNFYKPASLQTVIVNTPEEVSAVMNSTQGRSVLFLNPETQALPVIASIHKENIYCILPDWPFLNINDWESRSYIWSVYKLSAAK